MAEEENQREADEERMIRLSAPAVLDDAALKALMTEDIANNKPEYVAEVAKRYGLDPERDAAAVRDRVYEEQMNVITEACIANALDENTIDSYTLLQRACYFCPGDVAYMNAAEGENLSANIAKYIEERLSGVKALAPAIRFTNAVNEAILYSTGDYPNFTSYKANQLKEKFDDNDLKLTYEEKGKLNFIASKMYRKLGAQASPLSDNVAGVQEAECLRKVLTLSRDYKLISYCQNRLPGQKDEQNIVRAYKHALTKKQSRGDMYKINAELAALYLARARAVGFMTKNSSKEIAAGKAVKYLLGAYRHADREDRLPVLKRIADIQLVQGNIRGWVSTKEVIAMKFLKGEERCFVLNSIGDKTGEIEFYRKALEECDKARMPSSSKIHVREVTYEKIALKATDETVRKEAERQLAEVRRQKQQAYRQLLGGGKGKI